MVSGWSGLPSTMYTWTPFGDSFTAAYGPDQDKYNFAGLEGDSDGTMHAQFRNYQPNTAQWLSPDPYMGSYSLRNPQSFNRYAYVLNNPLALVDPTGLIEEICGYVSDEDGSDDYDYCLSSDSGGGSSSPGGGAGGSGIGNWAPGGYLGGVTWSPSTSAMFLTVAGAPINVPSLINNAKGLLSQRCKSKFGQKIPGYTTSRFFNTLSNATINQYPFATPPQDASSYGADAVTHPPGGPIDLLPNFYGRDPTSQAFVLIHEGIHLFGRGNLGDSAVQNLFGLPVTGNTENITQYIAAGCYP